jgi:hypothetical protein
MNSDRPVGQEPVPGGLIGSAGIEPCRILDLHSPTPLLDLAVTFVVSGLIALVVSLLWPQ